MPRARLYRIRSAEDWKKKRGDVNKFGAVIENPFVGSDGLCYTTTHCPMCGLPMTISKFGFSRFKGCESCRAGHKARDRFEDRVKGDLEKTLGNGYVVTGNLMNTTGCLRRLQRNAIDSWEKEKPRSLIETSGLNCDQSLRRNKKPTESQSNCFAACCLIRRQTRQTCSSIAKLANFIISPQ